MWTLVIFLLHIPKQDLEAVDCQLALQKVPSWKSSYQHNEKVSLPPPTPHQHWALSFKNCFQWAMHILRFIVVQEQWWGLREWRHSQHRGPAWAVPNSGQGFQQRGSVCTNNEHSPRSDILDSKPGCVTHGLVVSDKLLNLSGSECLQLYNGNYNNVTGLWSLS